MTGQPVRALLLLLLAGAGAAPDRPPAAAPDRPPAAAPDRPPAAVTRDALVGYHLRPAVGEAIDVRVELKVGGTAFRVDLPDSNYLVGAPSSRSLTMVVPLERTLVSIPWEDGPQTLFTVDEAARFTRRSDATVAGQRCTLWDAVSDGVTHLLCITADGLVLRNQFQDRQGRRNLVEAFSVRFEALADADFAFPDGFDPIVPNPGPVQ